jgi:hypothetical protein
MNLWPFSRRDTARVPVDPYTLARETFEACFRSYDAEIAETRSSHGRVSEALKAKREAVHAALRGGER